MYTPDIRTDDGSTTDTIEIPKSKLNKTINQLSALLMHYNKKLTSRLENNNKPARVYKYAYYRYKIRMLEILLEKGVVSTSEVFEELFQEPGMSNKTEFVDACDTVYYIVTGGPKKKGNI